MTRASVTDNNARETIFDQPLPLPVRQSAWWLYQHELRRIDPATRQPYPPHQVLENTLKWMYEQILLIESQKLQPNDIQRRMLQMLAEGLSEKQIAFELGMNVGTARVIFLRLRTRLGMQSMYQLMAHSVHRGWVKLKTNKDERPRKSK